MKPGMLHFEKIMLWPFERRSPRRSEEGQRLGQGPRRSGPFPQGCSELGTPASSLYGQGWMMGGLGLEDSCSHEHLEASQLWGPLPSERGHELGRGPGTSERVQQVMLVKVKKTPPTHTHMCGLLHSHQRHSLHFLPAIVKRECDAK